MTGKTECKEPVNIAEVGMEKNDYVGVGTLRPTEKLRVRSPGLSYQLCNPPSM